MVRDENYELPHAHSRAATPSMRWNNPVARLPLWPLLLGFGVASVEAWSTGSGSLLGESWSHFYPIFLHVIPLASWWATGRLRGHSVRAILGAPPTRHQLALVLAAVVAVHGFRVGWLACLAELDWVPESWERSFRSHPTAAWPTWLVLLVVAVIAPCTEEILFRGVIFQRLTRWAHPAFAALCSSLLFALLHNDSMSTLVSGLVLTALYLRTGSLWVPIAVHALKNATANYAGMLIEARDSLGWLIAGAQLVCVPWIAWFVYRSLRSTALAEAR